MDQKKVRHDLGKGVDSPENQRSIKGRGAQINTANPFSKHEVDDLFFNDSPVDDEPKPKTNFTRVHPKSLVNKVPSPDIGMEWSLNPYQGCEHGCIYCYARNSHEYWGYSAGMDFEQEILVKENAPQLLRDFLNRPDWHATPLMFSGNTDCYQPAERKFKLTRELLEICLQYRQPVGIITKNALILRDLDILKEMVGMNLVRVAVSITSADEALRSMLEPRTSTFSMRLKVIRELSASSIPVTAMLAPIIPGLNDHEIPGLLKSAHSVGASDASYIVVRLNGRVGELFENWVRLKLPSKSDKILSRIREVRGGKLNESRFSLRMKGEGVYAEMIRDVFKVNKRRLFGEPERVSLNSSLFRHPSGQQLGMFNA